VVARDTCTLAAGIHTLEVELMSDEDLARMKQTNGPLQSDDPAAGEHETAHSVVQMPHVIGADNELIKPEMLTLIEL
jgi:hypothetical protein